MTQSIKIQFRDPEARSRDQDLGPKTIWGWQHYYTRKSANLALKINWRQLYANKAKVPLPRSLVVKIDVLSGALVRSLNIPILVISVIRRHLLNKTLLKNYEPSTLF